LLGRLLNLPIAVAKSGFQHGGDAGPAGEQGRRFRIECKKYLDTTSLSDRELLGEIDQAIARDEALEAWILVATRSVPEQLKQDLVQKGEKIGVPVVILDWEDSNLSSLAALCTFDPDLVESEFSKEAGACTRTLQAAAVDTIEMLRRNLQSWYLGFEILRMKSHEKLDKIWSSPRSSNAELGQNAAGGAETKRVRRNAVHTSLKAWWDGPARSDSPAAVLGWDGVGKTWATLAWLIDNKKEQPVVLVIPSSAAASLSSVSETIVKRFLADRLYEVSGVRDPEHWLRRIDYLLKRPIDEGPVLTVFFDGLNQEPSVPWLSLLKVLQGDIFAGRVRVVISTRNHHFNDKLSRLRGLVVPTAGIDVDLYDRVPGGELDQMLRFEGLTQDDLHPDLIELARAPRLFKLVVQFRDRLVEAGQITIHRLLWEYGRDTLGVRAGKSFSEDEWQDWLKGVAQEYRDGVYEYSVKSLGETTSRPDLTENEIYARLSDIIDGRFAKPGPSGSLLLTPTVVAHALGTALLAHLDTVVEQTFEAIDAKLTQWIDPIAGFDQRAEILRAAVSILVERGVATAPSLTGVLVTAWLQTQNVTDDHRLELASLAPNLTDALLIAIEQSSGHANASSRLWAVNALRAIPRDNATAIEKIVGYVLRWLSIVSLDKNQRSDANTELEKNRSDRFKQRIGVDASGHITVVGVDIELVDQADNLLEAVAPSIIEGFPLTQILPIFEVSAVTLAVKGNNESWGSLKWLCLLNDGDHEETAKAFRNLSEAVRLRRPEPGINPHLPSLIASFLLRLSGQEIDEDAADAIDPGLNRVLTYEKDYLPDPGCSFFAVERRHAEMVLNNTELLLLFRAQRTEELWLDPGFEPPAKFVEEIISAAAHIDIEKLDRHIGITIEDNNFKKFELILSRCAPEILADLMRRKMQSIASSPDESRYWSAIRATNHLVLAGAAEAAAAQTLRLSSVAATEGEKCYADTQLLMLEIMDLDPQAQIDRLIQADLKFIVTDFDELIRYPTPNDVDALIARYAARTPKQQNDLLIILSIHPIKFSDMAWSWIEDFAKQVDHDLRHIAFYNLTRADAVRFGKALSTEGWSWSPDAHPWVNHYGTTALIAATQPQPFDQVAPKLAPWRLLEAARLRGEDKTEVQLAARMFSHVLAAEKIDELDPGSILTVDMTEAKSSPFTFSVTPRPRQEDVNNPWVALKEAMDIDAQTKAHKRAAETADSRIQEVWKAGASLYLTNMNAEDFISVLEHAPDMVALWLEGSQELTKDFRRRVRMAEAAYLALCEALLAHNPECGVQLWRALRVTITTNYLGAADINALLHLVFRVPESQPIIELRKELIGLKSCHTDKALFDISVTASFNGKDDWLASIIETDCTSELVWKRKRGVALAGFVINNTLPISGAWPDGELRTSYAWLKCKADRFRWIEACARHWWRAYLQAHDPADAYAAWVLFTRSADNRAWVWMREEIIAANDTSSFFKFKLSHARLNRSQLKNAMKNRAAKFDETFLWRKTVEGVGPWGKEPDVPPVN